MTLLVDRATMQSAPATVSSAARSVVEPVSTSPDGSIFTFKTTKSAGGTGPLATELLTELANRFRLGTFIETGTFMGDTVAAAIPVFGELHTIELSRDLAQKAAERFRSFANVHVHHGDSADHLAGILAGLSSAPLIWLDGHYSEGVTARGRGNTPVIDELKSIDRCGISNAVILIDDLRLFDTRESRHGDPASLGGYPSAQTLYTFVASMAQRYQLFVYGDVALILPSSAGVDVSPLIKALTISRLYDGTNLAVDEVLAAEALIAATRGHERDALYQLAQSSTVRTTEGYGLGLHYRFWAALAALGDAPAVAEQELTAVIELGFNHWRAKWHLAQACTALGKAAETRGLLTEVIASSPGFAAASAMLRTHEPAFAAGASDLDKIRAAGLWSEGQPLRLHLGCGERRFEGYINIDQPPDQHNVMEVKADYHANITQMIFPPGSVDEIRLHHVFEHFNRVTALAMLIRWQQWLKVGGKLSIETPDLVGSAEVLLSNAAWSVKMGTVRHLAGDQAAPWAYHIDQWFPERFQHTLKRLGFGRVETETSRWPHPPHLCNVHAFALKTELLGLDQLLKAADDLLRESLVAPAEEPTYAVWSRQLRAVLNDVPCGPDNIHTSAREAPLPSEGALPLDAIHDFNQRGRDRWVRAKAATIPAGSRVLDVGAGTCLYRSLFAHCDYKTHDFAKYEGAEKHGGTSAYGKIDYVSDILAIPAPDCSFDVILCTEVLEHVPEPIKVLQEISRLLRPGGRALLTAPLGSGLHQLPFHFYGGYTPEWYRRFGTEAGMEAVEITPNGGFFKHLAQECARAGGVYSQNPRLRGPQTADLRTLLLETLPRLFFGLDDQCFDERFTVGYFVELVKGAGKVLDADSSKTRLAAPPVASKPIVVKLMGGLGNQMFQYAMGLALARKNDAPLLLDLTFLEDRTPRPNFTQRSYALDIFPLHEGCTPIKDAKSIPSDLVTIAESGFLFDPNLMELPAGALLEGYWQSPRYFEGIEVELKNAFALAPELAQEDRALAARIEGDAAVCLHVRRGDMAHNAQTASIHGTCTLEYYQSACDVMARTVPNAHFYIFSDDPEWCRSRDLTRGRPRTVVSHTSQRDATPADLYLMRLCKHFIIANSTFSWWAAYLGGSRGKTVIAPEPWFSIPELDSTDLLPTEWIRLCRNPGPVLPPQGSPPAVSVVIPCYKQAHYLAAAIESVVAQTFPDWELIVVNDGSPDDTSGTARDIIARHPERRIRLLEKTNGGLADARNAGIKEARGRYILPLDADDKIHPEMLQTTVAVLDANPQIAIAYTDLIEFGTSSRTVRAAEYNFSVLPLQNHLNCCSLFRREAWVGVGGYNPNMKLGYEDWDFWVGCGEKGFFGRHIPRPLFFYRVKGSSMYTKARENHRELHAQLVMNHPRLFNEATRNEALRLLAVVTPAAAPADARHRLGG